MSQPDSPLETFWRSTIMLGTLIVGGMAVYVYGPSADQAIAFVDQASARVQELMADNSASQPAAPAPVGASMFAPRLEPGQLAPLERPATFEAPTGAPALAAAPSQAAPFQAAPFEAPPAVTPRQTESPRHDVSLASLSAELTSLGAEQIDVRAWGGSGQFHRVQFTAPLTAGAEGFRRHFEAVEPTAAGAMTTALRELREWRSGAAAPMYR